MNPNIYELQGMLARRDDFLAALLHELRNPLVPIANAVEVLIKYGDDRSRMSGACTIIQRQLRLLTRLVDDLADAAQIMRGHIALQRKTIDLAEAVAMAVEMAQPLIDSREHRLTSNVPSSTLVVEADELRLAQVVANLLINAAKYTRIGGRIEVSGERVAKTAVIRVRDNGIGIEPEMMELIFKPFTQGATCSQVAKGGLGMGLAVARQLIELHGGSITVHSDGAGRGSEFAIFLPSCGRN